MKADEILQKLQSGEMVLVKRETAQKMGLHPQTVVEVVEDRMRRAFAGEPVPELEGKPFFTYGDAKRMGLQVATPATDSIIMAQRSLDRDMRTLDAHIEEMARPHSMPRHTPEYKEAVQRVKISYLTENLGLDIKGIIHVGANDGYEMQWYKKMGIRHLMGIEPLPSAIKLFKEHYPDIPLGEFALGEHEGASNLLIASGDGQGSSLFCELGTTWNFEGHVGVSVHRWDSLTGIQYELYDCLVMDVQGYEMPALVGFGSKLDYIQYINIELSKEPIYEGGAPAAQVIEYLESKGFVQMSRTEEHNDVFFVRKGTPLKNLKINLGSGQRPFQSPWINCDIEDRWHPHIVVDGAHMPMFPDGSAEVIVLSHTLEHYGCNEGNGMLAECYRILQPGGSLIVSVPDLIALARGWINGKIDDETYVINLYGAFMGSEADRHKFGFTEKTLRATLETVARWSRIKDFNNRKIPGMDLASDWWILSLEAVK